MAKVRAVTKKVAIDLDGYHNSGTGETMSSELKRGTSVVVHEKTGKITISSSDYAILDCEALMVMSRLINNSDLANVMKMAVTLRTSGSIIHNNNVPHTNETLQKYLGIKSEAMYMQLIGRLIKKGILYQVKGLIYGEVRRYYALNPFIIRRGKLFDEGLTADFKEFR